ncbi:MAG: PTS sugar transporter subunit IIB [Lawsonibacter sp.]|nr:PTS sugar transporter subunit IIB [Lawsonibacter sp.]
MRNIALTRIDDRLIHGQVVTAWVKQTDANQIIIVDGPLTKDVFMQKVLRSAAPAGITVKVMNSQDASDYLMEEGTAGEKIILLVKIPQELEALVDGGVKLPVIVLGGMGAKTGRQKFNKNVSASPQEVECLKHLEERGCAVQYQLVPDEKPTPLSKML